MRFTIPVSIDTAQKVILSQEAQIPILADTVVECDNRNDRWDSAPPVDIPRTSFVAPPKPKPLMTVEYKIKREWKGKYGIRYTVLSLSGKLEYVSAQETAVTIKPNLHWMAFVILGLAAFFLIASFTSQPASRNGIYFLVSLLFIGFLLIDVWVLSSIYQMIRNTRV